MTTYEFAGGITLPGLVQPANPWTVTTLADSVSGLSSCLRPPSVANGGSTDLKFTVLANAGTGQIWMRPSSEFNFDWLRLLDSAGTTTLAQVSGLAANSTMFNQPVTVLGRNTFTLRYLKDAGGAAGQDTGYVYRIIVPTYTLPNATVAGKATATVGMTVVPPPGTYTFTAGITLPNLVQPANPWYITPLADTTTGLSFALRPPTIANLQDTDLAFSFTGVAGTGQLWVRTSSASLSDYFQIRLNGSLYTSASGTPGASVLYTFPVTNGLNSVVLRYSKDISGAAGADTAYVFKIIVPLAAPSTFLLIPAAAAGHGSATVSITRIRKLIPAAAAGHGSATVSIARIRTVGLLPSTAAAQATATVSIAVVLAAGILRELSPDPVAGQATATVWLQWPARLFVVDTVRGTTTATADLDMTIPVPDEGALRPDAVYGDTDIQLTLTLAHFFDLDVVAGRTDVSVLGDVGMEVDTVRGSTEVDVALVIGLISLTPDPVAGHTLVRIIHTPDLSNNTPILLAFSMSARLESMEPLVSE